METISGRTYATLNLVLANAGVNRYICMVTIWTPRIEGKKGPRYLAIVEGLFEDLAAGKLHEGSRLPTHRDLAERLGVTVGTVSRAYAEAARRGLVSGEVGRGTFVRGTSGGDAGSSEAEDVVDLGQNHPPDATTVPQRTALLEALARLTVRRDLAMTMPHYEVRRPLERSSAAAAGYYVTTGIGPDLFVASKTAVREMIDRLVATRGLAPIEAYELCSVALDLKISEIVDHPNYVVSAFLPNDLFVAAR